MIINPYRFSAAGGTGFLLDDYTGAVGAYSLRELSSSYVDVDIITIRRTVGSPTTSSFTATEIADGTMFNWVTESNGAASGLVTNWVDQTGNGNDIANATDQQPAIILAGSLVLSGGEKALSFDGSTGTLGDRLVTAATNSFFTGSNFSVFTVCERDTTNTDPLWGNDNATTAEGRAAFNIAPSEVAMSFNGSNTGTDLSTFPLTTQTLITLVGTGMLTGETHAVKSWVDGADEQSSAPTSLVTPAAAKFVLGDNRDDGAGWGGLIQECIVYSSDETSNQSAIDSNITTYYGI